MSIIEAVKQEKPDPELVAMTKRIIEQNDAILHMNGRLLELITLRLALIRIKDTGSKGIDLDK